MDIQALNNPRFEDIPLQQVDLSLILGEARIFSALEIFHFIQEISIDLGESELHQLPAALYQDNVSMTKNPFVARAFSAETGIDALLYHNAVSIRWSKYEDTAIYPGFKGLQRPLALVENIFRDRAEILRLRYRVQIPNMPDRNLWGFLRDEWIPKRVSGDVTTFEIATNYRLQSGVDFKLSGMVTQNGLELVTDAGIKVEGDNVIEKTDFLHTEMLDEFIKTVTPEFRELWKFNA